MTHRAVRRISTIAAVIVSLIAAETGAAGSAMLSSPIAKASLIAEQRAVVPGRSVHVALRLIVPDGWHTYWSNPGETGAPTIIQWDLPDGFVAGPTQWPWPERIVAGPTVSYGLYGDVVLLTELMPPFDLALGTTVRLAANVEWLVCADICIPEYQMLEVVLPVEQTSVASPPHARAIFSQGRARLPQPFPWPAEVKVGETAIELVIGASSAPIGPVDGAHFFPFASGVIDDGALQVVGWNGPVLTLVVPRPRGTLRADAPFSGVLVIRHHEEERGYLLGLFPNTTEGASTDEDQSLAR